MSALTLPALHVDNQRRGHPLCLFRAEHTQSGFGRFLSFYFVLLLWSPVWTTVLQLTCSLCDTDKPSISVSGIFLKAPEKEEQKNTFRGCSVCEGTDLQSRPAAGLSTRCQVTSSKFHYLSAGAVWVSVRSNYVFLPNFIRLISGLPALTPSASTQTFLSLFLKTENQQRSLFSLPHTGPKKTLLPIAASPGAALYRGASSW